MFRLKSIAKLILATAVCSMVLAANANADSELINQAFNGITDIETHHHSDSNSDHHGKSDHHKHKKPCDCHGKGGATGATGAAGATGATGATGPAGSTTIIPYASGISPLPLANALGVQTGGVIGFGTSSLSTITIPLNITGVPFVGQYAFTMPRAGTLTNLEVSFTLTVTLNVLVTPGFVEFQLWESTGGGIFTPIAGTDVLLTIPPLSILGTTVTGNTTFSVPVAQGTSLLLVATIPNGSVIAAVAGFASAGLEIQ